MKIIRSTSMINKKCFCCNKEIPTGDFCYRIKANHKTKYYRIECAKKCRENISESWIVKLIKRLKDNYGI